MPTINIPFGEWLPSAPSFKNPGCEVADNVIPASGGAYDPFPGPSVFTNVSEDPWIMTDGYWTDSLLWDDSQIWVDGPASVIDPAVTGARQYFTNDGASVIAFGREDRLGVLRATSTETLGINGPPDGEYWDFARFNDFIIATNGQENPQYLDDIDTATTWVDLPGSPPVAKRCAKVGEFLMLGNIDGARNRIQWSAFNNPAGTWGTDRQTQAGLADLDSQFGAVQSIVGGRYATVFQERGIQRLSYVGPPVVWRADVIEQDRGCAAPMSVVSVGYTTFFLAQDGFYITNGSNVQPIGSNRINAWFFDNVNQQRIDEVFGAIDWQNECVVWAFPSSSSVSLDRFIIYSWAQQRWSSATVFVDCLVGSQVDGTSLENLDAIYGDLDSIPISLDDPSLGPGARVLASFVDGAYVTYSGQPLEATWQTGEAQPAPAQRVFVSEVYPMIVAESWDSSIQVSMRGNRGVQEFSQPRTTGWAGFAAVRGEGQKVAIRMVKPAGTQWSEAQGVQVMWRGAGKR